MIPRRLFLFALTFFFFADWTLADENIVHFYKSPNEAFKAQVIRVHFDDVERSHDIVKIFNKDSEITEDVLARNDKEMGRYVYDAKWSPDSRFFVFLTLYGGGYSIWHHPTTVYDSKENKFWELDDFAGSVVDEKILFRGSDTLIIKVMNPKAGAYGSPVVKTLPLSKFLKF
jgi:hypothetical protein